MPRMPGLLEQRVECLLLAALIAMNTKKHTFLLRCGFAALFVLDCCLVQVWPSKLTAVVAGFVGFLALVGAIAPVRSKFSE